MCCIGRRAQPRRISSRPSQSAQDVQCRGANRPGTFSGLCLCSPCIRERLRFGMPSLLGQALATSRRKEPLRCRVDGKLGVRCSQKCLLQFRRERQAQSFKQSCRKAIGHVLMPYHRPPQCFCPNVVCLGGSCVAGQYDEISCMVK